ncbi:MAG: hypothetical protein R2847_10450 [Bacteroidia bacterium]
MLNKFIVIAFVLASNLLPVKSALSQEVSNVNVGQFLNRAKAHSILPGVIILIGMAKAICILKEMILADMILHFIKPKAMTIRD